MIESMVETAAAMMPTITITPSTGRYDIGGEQAGRRQITGLQVRELQQERANPQVTETRV